MKKKIFAITVVMSLIATMFAGMFSASAAITGSTAMTNFNKNAVNSDDWFINSVAGEKANPDLVKVTDGALAFKGAGDGCSFGATGLYKNFTIRFDAKVEEGSTFIGVCFGSKNPLANFWDADAAMIYFQTANTDAFYHGAALLSDEAAGVGTDNGGGRGWTRPGYEQWGAAGSNPDVLTYKIVVKDGSASVYYKKASDPESVLSDLRIRFNGLGDTTGYVKICSTAGATFTIDNVKILTDTAADSSAAIADDVIATTVRAVSTGAVTATAADITATSAKISWTKETGALSYRVNVFTKGSDNSYTFVKSVDVANVAEAAVSGLTADTTYGYQLISYVTAGLPSNYSAVVDAKTAVIPVSSTPVSSAPASSKPATNPNTSDYYSFIILAIGLSASAVFAFRKKLFN